MNNKVVDKTTFIIIMQHTAMHQLNPSNKPTNLNHIVSAMVFFEEEKDFPTCITLVFVPFAPFFF